MTPGWSGVFSFYLWISLASTCFCESAAPIEVGSKSFTESVILGEIATQLGNESGVVALHRSQLGGTRILWEAMVSGQIDAYSEYTGTISRELLPGTPPDIEALRRALAQQGIGITESLGFSNTYALGMPENLASRLNIRTISDLRAFPELRMAFSNEFINRVDGWPAIRAAYRLPQTSVNGLDHDLAYRAVASRTVDVTDLYTTDAEIISYGLRVLQDDKRVFPPYQAVFLYRLDLAKRAPGFLAALKRLEGTIDTRTMVEMNAASKLQHIPEARIASTFLMDRLYLSAQSPEPSLLKQLGLRTREHLILVSISLAASILVAIPLGIIIFKWPRIGYVLMNLVAVVYTIPSLALLVMMIPLFGIGTWPAIVALFLYGLLPIVRNTHSGLKGISRGLRESAVVLGLSSWSRLIRIELPMAAPAILAGIKTAAVINVGTATLGALIGAGGYGQPILTGIRLADTKLILLGAVPSALLALLVQGGFGILERLLVPRGLRLQTRS